MNTSTTENRILKVISIVGVFILWQVASVVVGSELKLPSPVATFYSLIELVTEGKLLTMLGSTFYRGLLSIVISFIMAIILGSLAGLVHRIGILLEPPIQIIRSTPTIALIFILLSMLNSGGEASVVICILIVFPILYSNIRQGIEQVDEGYIEMAKIYKVGPIRRYLELYLPGIKSFVLAGITATIGLNFKVMIAAEVLGEVKHSIGKSMFVANVNLDKPRVFAWCLVMIIMVFLIERAWKWVIARSDKA